MAFSHSQNCLLFFFRGSLANVAQIGIEFHNVPRYIKQYFTIIQGLYKLGFVTINWEENLAQGPTLFEIVFKRSNLATCR